MRDPFPLARLSGIVALANTDRFYTLKDVATKVLPSLCMLTIDPEKDVRDEAFKTIKKYMEKLERVSEQPEKALEFEKDVESCALDLKNETSWTSWAMNSLSTKMSNYKNKGQQPSVALNTQPLGPPPGLSKTDNNISESTKNKDSATKLSPQQNSSNSISKLQEKRNATSTSTTKTSNTSGGGDGWAFDDDNNDDWKDLEDDDENMEPLEPVQSASYLNSKTKPNNAISKNNNNEFSQDWSNSFEETHSSKKTSSSNFPSASSYNWGQDPVKDDEDLFSSLVKDISLSNKSMASNTQAKQTSFQQVQNKANNNNSDWSSDWDSFDTSNSSQNSNF